MEIARTVQRSNVPGELFFGRWCDLPSHPEWAPSMEYFVLDGPFGLGATGRSRPVGGDEARFTVTAVGPGWVYADATDLGGAVLTVHHEASETDGITVITLTASLEGPRATELVPELGPVLQDALERDLASLIALLEGQSSAATHANR